MRPGSVSCESPADCDDSDRCILATCVDSSCGYEAVVCPEGQECSPLDGACVVVPTVVSFREGTDGYLGGWDTFITEAAPEEQYGDQDVFEWDGEDSGGENFGLLRFGELFEEEGGPIARRASIESATLTYTIEDQGNVGEVYESLVGWDESVTFSTLGATAGVQPEDLGLLVASTEGALGTFTLDVTASVVAWANTPASNQGWIIVPTGTGGVGVSSSESEDEVVRPTLTITFQPPAPCEAVSDCDDQDACT